MSIFMYDQFTDEDRQTLEGYLHLLDDKERFVIVHRFGLEGEKPKTLAAVGEMLNYKVGRERVRQLQNIALSKIRDLMIRERTKSVANHISP